MYCVVLTVVIQYLYLESKILSTIGSRSTLKLKAPGTVKFFVYLELRDGV